MGDAEDLSLLRQQYEQALARYEAVCSALNRQLAAGTAPSAEAEEREREARAVLDVARRSYLDAWLLP